MRRRRLETRSRDLVEQLRPQKKMGPEFTDFAARFLVWAHAERQKPSSLVAKASMFRLYLTPKFRGRRLGEIAERDVLELKQRWGELDAMPLMIDSPKVERPVLEFYDYEQYAELLAGAAEVGPIALAMCLLAGDAGLRMGELLALELRDVDLRRRELWCVCRSGEST